MSTCRFCKRSDFAGQRRPLVKYGARHYACHACYLDAGKNLSDLHDWQIVNFPYLLLKDRGLDQIAIDAWARVNKDVA